MSGEVFLKLSEVCDLLHVDIATGHNWVKLGKLVPSGEDLRGRPLFSQSSVQKQLQDVRKLCDPRLKSRRNKSALRGRGLYGNYAGRNSGNVGAVNELILRLKGGKGMMCACLLEAAIRLLHAAGRIPTPSCLPHGSYFLAWRSGFIDPFPYDFLLEPLMEHHSAESLCSYTEKLPEFTLEYIPYEDTLGLLYLSLCDISSRLEGGRYYTPQDLTDEVVADLGDEHDRFLDPCCGSGNFLLRLLKRGVTPENLYGADIDAISLALCRINFAVNTAVSEKEFYKRHFILGNTLRIPDLPECNVILGNPPWGSCTDRELTQEYAKSFVSAGRNRPCMADLFVERMLMQLPLGGILRFLLPESLLNVAVHQKLRSLISQTAKVRQVRYLGEVFHAVQCPSVVLTLKKGEGAGEEHSGIEVTLPERSFTVQRKSCGDFNFKIDDDEYALLKRIESVSPQFDLAAHVEFVMGIVTGDNRALLHKDPEEGMVGVLRGTDIEQFKISPAQEYLRFDPEILQQCAAEKLYRSAPKILYRFIAKYPVAAIQKE